jgi:hypothetical protein
LSAGRWATSAARGWVLPCSLLLLGAVSRAEEGLEWEVEGYVRSELRLRTAEGESDLDLTADLFLDAARGGTRPMEARFNGRAHLDIAGDSGPGELLYDVWDSFQHALQARFYEGWFEAGNLFDAALAVRAGRQFTEEESTYLQFDGVRADLGLEKQVHGLQITVLGGVPVRFGETDRSGNWLAGLIARWRPQKATRLHLEYYHVSEEVEGFNDPVTDPDEQPETLPAGRLDDDLVALNVWHKAMERLSLFGRFSLLNGDANELRLNARWTSADTLWTVFGEFEELFQRLFDVTNDLTPFVPMLGSLEPYVRFTARASRRIGEEWIIDFGGSWRALLDDADESEFNHDYLNGLLSATRLGLVEGKLDLTLVVNGYSTSGDDVLAVGGSGDFKLTGTVTLSGGIDYQLYKYDWLTDDEREDVWTYWARVRWKWKKNWTVGGGASVDVDRYNTYFTLYVNLTVRF